METWPGKGWGLGLPKFSGKALDTGGRIIPNTERSRVQLWAQLLVFCPPHLSRTKKGRGGPIFPRQRGQGRAHTPLTYTGASTPPPPGSRALEMGRHRSPRAWRWHWKGSARSRSLGSPVRRLLLRPGPFQPLPGTCPGGTCPRLSGPRGGPPFPTGAHAQRGTEVGLRGQRGRARVAGSLSLQGRGELWPQKPAAPTVPSGGPRPPRTPRAGTAGPGQ